MKLILASASSGRRQLLESLKIPFEVMETDIDEEKIVDRDPVKMAVARAEAKARAALAAKFQISNFKFQNKFKYQKLKQNNFFVETQHAASHAGTQDAVGIASAGSGVASDRETHGILIIAADTVGFLGNWIFGKPKSRQEAEGMLKKLSGKTHKYVSAHAIIKFETNLKQKRLSYFQHLTSGYDIASVTLRRLTQQDISFYLSRVPFTKLCGGIQIMNSPQNFVVATEGSLSTIIGLSLEKIIPELLF